MNWSDISGHDTVVSLIVWGKLGNSWSLGPGLGSREAGRGAEIDIRETEGEKVNTCSCLVNQNHSDKHRDGHRTNPCWKESCL